jgi:sec-independent protein translocase protein TatC
MNGRKRRIPKKLKADEKVPFIQHLEELRYRLIVSIVAVAVGTIVAFLFKERIFQFLAQPLLNALPPQNKHLIFTGLYEAFMVYLKASFLAGFMVSVPVIVYQIWAFVAPGLYVHEKKNVIPFVVFASLFFVGGAFFGYYVVFPYGFRFFLGFAGDFIQPLPSMKEYLSFATRLLLAFGVVFELPIFIFFLTRIGVVDASKLKKGRKYAIPIVFTAAAILTPPDVITQLLMAAPLLLLYEVGIWVSVFFGRKHSVDEEEAQSAETPPA